MENKNPFQNGANSAVPIQGVGIHEPPGPDALSQDLERSGVVIKELPAHRSRWLQTDIILVLLLIVGTILSFYMITRSQKQNFSSSSSLSQFETTRLPLNDLKIDTTAWSDSGPKSVIINGDLQVSESFVLLPSLQPTGARPGELYYDKGTNQLAYFNGTNFVFLTGPSATPGGVQSLGGATGRLLLGAGVDISRERLENTGVLSVQGQAGDVTLTAGPGIIINGTSFGNSGVISVTAGSPNVTVTNDDGNVTLSVTSGAGTITSSGGTIGTVPLFTAAQNIENSIISQSGLAVTISGDLNVVTGGLTLSNALTVSNGGTGTASLGINGVLVGNGTAAISSVAAGGSGLCLVSTAGAPAWSACPGATGVSSLNGLTGALTIANSSAAGSTITLDNASTTTKGIASFNATNFTASSGLIDTSQDINASATPTFSGVNTNTITPSATLTVGSTGQQLILQGNASTQLTATGGGFTTAIGFAGTPTGALTYNFDRAATSGTYTICTSIGNCASAAGGVTTLGGTTNAIALFTGSQTIDDSIISQSGTTINIAGSLALTNALGVGQGGTGLNATPTNGQLLIGNGSGYTQATLTNNGGLTISNGAGSVGLAINYGSGANTAVQGDTTLVCPSGTGNLSGTGNTITLGSGGTCASLNTVNNPSFTTSVTTPLLTSTGALNITPGGTLTVGVTTQTLTLQGGASTTLSATSGIDSTILDFAAPSGTQTITLPSATGTICLQSATACGFAPASGSANYIQNQSASAQSSSNFWISGTGKAATSLLAPAFDVPAAGGLSIGTSTATSLTFGNAANTTPITMQGGTITTKSTTNTTSAFRVLNASDVPLFQVDSSNNRVYVGDPTADSTGALLVLDTKDTTGDPTGVNGGSYYNSKMGRARCYESSSWRNCSGLSRPNDAHTAMLSVTGASATPATAWTGYGASLTHQANTNGNNVTPRPYLTYVTSAVSGNVAGVWTNRIFDSSFDSEYILYQSYANISTTTSERMWWGLTQTSDANMPTTMPGSATPNDGYAAFRYDTSASDSTFQCVTNNFTGSPTVVDSGVSPSGEHALEVLLSTTRAIFRINGDEVCNITTNIALPSANRFRAFNTITTLTTATRTLYTSWLYVEEKIGYSG